MENILNNKNFDNKNYSKTDIKKFKLKLIDFNNNLISLQNQFNELNECKINFNIII